ncbi:hypothetical protein GCM10009760_33370 [Kitasatospora kazusensis]|uniref:Uncharacterized protein n=1 Tax=Kitasatospora kazusensis TaxID=407974 RepID=A0ABP5LFN9_9ACTN
MSGIRGQPVTRRVSHSGRTPVRSVRPARKCPKQGRFTGAEQGESGKMKAGKGHRFTPSAD